MTSQLLICLDWHLADLRFVSFIFSSVLTSCCNRQMVRFCAPLAENLRTICAFRERIMNSNQQYYSFYDTTVEIKISFVYASKENLNVSFIYVTQPHLYNTPPYWLILPHLSFSL